MEEQSPRVRFIALFMLLPAVLCGPMAVIPVLAGASAFLNHRAYGMDLFWCVAFGAASFGCWRVRKGLYREKAWSWYAALLVSLGTLWFALLPIWDLYHPRRDVSYTGDEGYAALASPLLALPCLLIVLLLLLPGTRLQFLSSR